jgi:SNF2 family DNA or RNA helicase
VPDDAVRFAREQALLLDAWLEADGARADADEVAVDDRFAAARLALREAADVAPCDAPPGFGTTLRPYQRVGLGWLHALQRLGLGGVLADDMGLGKTVQVLALLEARRQAGAGPSLVVVPRSLVHNWVAEAERLAPAMRVHVHHGTGAPRAPWRCTRPTSCSPRTARCAATPPSSGSIEFDHAVLDEAQAIKNAATSTAARRASCARGTAS